MVLALFLLLLQTTEPAPKDPSPPADSTPPYNPNSAPDRNDLHKPLSTPIFPRLTIIKGRVASAAGGSLPAPASVEAICAGSHQQAIFTTGDFAITLSTNNTPSEPNSSSCSLRISLSGFHGVFIPVNSSGGMGPDVGQILLRPRTGVTAVSYSATSLYAPPKARKAYEKAVALAAKNKLAEARKELTTATTLHPNYAAAWCELGDLLNRLSLPAESWDAYQKAANADPKFLRPVLHMAILAAGHRKWQESIMLTDRVITLNPFDFPEAFLYNAAALYNLGHTQQAEQAVLRAIELDTAHLFPKNHHLLATIQAAQGDRRRAAENLRLFLKYAPNSPEADQVRAQLDAWTQAP